MKILYIQAFFKTVRLIMIISMITYFIGMVFYIYSDLTSEIEYAEGHEVQTDDFINYNNLQDKTPYARTVIMIYFTFTSLSTVGFGDYHPKSNPERILAALVLLFGVAIFSLVLGNFTDIVQDFNKLTASFDDGDDLSKFFGLLKAFNFNKDLNP
jgi:hypothetical protein